MLILRHDPIEGQRLVGVSGFYVDASRRQGSVRDGTFDPATGRLSFTFYQPWDRRRGHATLQLASDGQSLAGDVDRIGAARICGVWKRQSLSEVLNREGRVLLYRVWFDYASAEIRRASEPVLDELGRLLREDPRLRLRIEGHCCAIGSVEVNLWWSWARVEAVRDYLVRQCGVDPTHLTAKGWGKSRPIADNATAEGRALNRRVEVVREP